MNGFQSQPDVPKPELSLEQRVARLEEGKKLPVIEIRVGSDSDFPKIQGILTGLEDYPVVVRIASAHRTPEAMAELARAFPNVLILCESDEKKGLLDQGGAELAKKLEVVCCIAAAGGSAHIAGMTASETEVPVLAYPVPSSALGQSESDASMRHMPPGIPNGVSANQGVIATMARKIYNNARSFNGIDIPEELVDDKAHALIERFGLKVIRTLDNIDIGIHIYDVNEEKVECEDYPPMHVGNFINRQTDSLGSGIPIVIPCIKAPLNTDNRSRENILREGIIAANMRVVPGLSMGLAVREKVNPTNAILFAAKLIAINNAETREALRIYREELASGVRTKDINLVADQLR